MKIAVIVLALGVVTCGFGQELRQPPTVSVSGSAEVKVVPDEIYLRVGVETRDGSVEQAKKENDARISKALAFLKASEIASKDVQTDFISAEPLYEGAWQSRPTTFVVRKSIEVKLTNVVRFEGILTGLLTNGVNAIHAIDFRTSQLRKHRDTARAMAIRAAKEKAEALASELGVKCGKVYTISANEWGGYAGSYWGGRFGAGMYQNAVQNAGPGSGESQDALAIGQISVSASVNVAFLIE